MAATTLPSCRRHVAHHVRPPVAAAMRILASRPAPRAFLHGGPQCTHVLRGGARGAICMAVAIQSTPRAPPRNACGMAGRHAAVFATTWWFATRRTSRGASCHDYIFQTSFLSPHNLFALPLPYSSRYTLPSSTCEVPIGTCQVFKLQSGLRAPNGILLVCSVVRVICVVRLC